MALKNFFRSSSEPQSFSGCGLASFSSSPM